MLEGIFRLQWTGGNPVGAPTLAATRKLITAIGTGNRIHAKRLEQ